MVPCASSAFECLFQGLYVVMLLDIFKEKNYKCKTSMDKNFKMESFNCLQVEFPC